MDKSYPGFYRNSDHSTILSDENYYSIPPRVYGKRSFKSIWWAKRLLDIFGAILLMVLLSPLMLIVAVLIKLDSPGKVIYRQERVGRGGKLFEMLKFRSMRHHAEDYLETLIQDNPDHHVSWQQYQKLLNDPRLTTIGRIIRRLSIDELPQLWNALKGEMSLVGPRPFLPQQKRVYGDAYQHYIGVRPGMTGLWQINGRNLTSFKDRARLDVIYIHNRSLLLDVNILVRTIGVVIRGEGAY